ncbi:MAG: NUDIX hydrolase [Pseudomonadota bacterium]
MHRHYLLTLLKNYQPYDKDERGMYEMLVRFVENQSQCFERHLRIGHITGSAWIVDRERRHVLLTHHRKLDRWLQLGGHADGETDVLAVALREAREESGVESIKPLLTTPFDIDVHSIPARGDEPRHLHYDVRWLLEADRAAPLVISSESKDLAWVALEDIGRLTTDRSIARMTEKLPTD